MKDRVGALALEIMANAQAEADYTGHPILQRVAIASSHRTLAEMQVQLEQTHLGILFDESEPASIPLSVGMWCHGCGCTELDACPDGCAWSSPNVCTNCAPDIQYMRRLGGGAH